jgi:phosphotransferase system enzyme I (PtsI)
VLTTDSLPQPTSPTKIWTGLPVSSGIAHGIVHVLKENFDEPERETIDPSQIESHIERLHQAIAATKEEIEALQDSIIEEGGDTEADIFDAHILILTDRQILRNVEHTVRKQRVTVDYAYYQLMLKHINALRDMPDPYIRERFLDIKDVTHRVMRHLRGELLQTPKFDHPVVIVAYDLTPSDTVQLDRSRVLGFAIETGSTTSHAAIIARSMDVPAVGRLPGISEQLHSGDIVLLDGDEGTLIFNPTPEQLALSKEREAAADQLDDSLHCQRHEPAQTLDGIHIVLGANGEFLEEISYLKDSGAEEVGLFRTEFLHIAAPDATEDQLTAAYRQVIEGMAPQTVIFRTLDLGGDKVEESYQSAPEPNPFLGWRGIRLCLGHQELFTRQLRALLRAGSGHQIGIMFPMITNVQEVLDARRLLDQCQRELLTENHPLPSRTLIGAMVEIPAAALQAHQIAQHVDFLSLGTNDLVQYTLAVDRLNSRVADLYQPTHPAVLRLMELTVQAGATHNIHIGICGEMAADLEMLPLLLGIGLRELSVAASQVARVKAAVRRLSIADCRQLWQQASQSAHGAEIAALSSRFAYNVYPDLLE